MVINVKTYNWHLMIDQQNKGVTEVKSKKSQVELTGIVIVMAIIDLDLPSRSEWMKEPVIHLLCAQYASTRVALLVYNYLICLYTSMQISSSFSRTL